MYSYGNVRISSSIQGASIRSDAVYHVNYTHLYLVILVQHAKEQLCPCLVTRYGSGAGGMQVDTPGTHIHHGKAQTLEIG